MRTRAVLYNGLGRYQDALTAATATDAFEGEGITIYTQGLVELIEAAARAGAPDRAADALLRLEEMTHASSTAWGAGVRARSQALLRGDDAAEPLYREAIERLGRTRVRPQLARAHLVYGEWLRRENRRVDARRELMDAFDMFTDMGMVAFSEPAEPSATDPVVASVQDTFAIVRAAGDEAAAYLVCRGSGSTMTTRCSPPTSSRGIASSPGRSGRRGRRSGPG